jgi:DivIVA domain-containing protein
MDVTPRELRDVEIREAFRGYNRDEVNDLLERAAAAIEALNERTRVLGERLASGQTESGRGRDTEDMLHRTLLLAQRASDEAIAEAEEKARVMVEDAETRSRRMLADAAIEARRTTESERRRLEQEIAELQHRSEALTTDVDGLERFESDYRTRLMSAMEADLHAIERDLQVIRDRSDSMPGDRPALTATDTIATPPPVRSADVRPADVRPADVRPPDVRPPDANETQELDVRSLLDEDKAKPLIGSAGMTGSQPISDAAQAAASEMVGGAAPESTATESAKAPVVQAPATIDLFGAEQQAAVESTALDDDSFFASLRDAVRDDAPPGPRDAAERSFFDQDDSKDSPNFREAFKRRR